MANDTSAPISSSSEKPPADPTRQPSQPTLGTEIVSGFLGVGIAVGCVLPPLIHLITGPLGPFIGGFVAGNRAQPGARGRVVIATMIGTGLAAIIAIAATVFARLVGKSELPRWFPSSGTLLAIVGAVWVYGTVMAAIGTTMSSTLARRRAAEQA